jgi:hypothetical protein
MLSHKRHCSIRTVGPRTTVGWLVGTVLVLMHETMTDSMPVADLNPTCVLSNNIGQSGVTSLQQQLPL